MYPSKAKGFTLVELMTVVAIIAVLAVIAMPGFNDAMRSNRVATATNALLASVALARTEAIRSRARGVLCTSADGAACGGDWNSGWLVWSDIDNSGTVNGAETVVRYVQGNPTLQVAGSANLIAFDGRGRAVAGAQWVGIQPEGVTTPARCVTIRGTGQTRVAKEACS